MHFAMRHIYFIFAFSLESIPMKRGREAPKTLYSYQ